jgi:formylglycine-generating enzyme required for sulfatase activity
MIILRSLCLTVLLGPLACALALQVDNVQFAQRADGSRLVDIGYEIDEPGTVAVELSVAGGPFQPVDPAFLSGDLGEVPAGSHGLVFDLGAYGELSVDDAVFRVLAEPAALPEMVLVPAGSFIMGQTGIYDAPEHEVVLTRSFYLGMSEITNHEYLEALQWACDHPELTGVSATTSTVTAYGVGLLDLDATDYCEIAFDGDTQLFYLVARTYSNGWSGPGFAYPGGSYDPGSHPVKEVSWYGAACFCDWRSLREGLPPYYNGLWNQTPSPNNPYDAGGYRLPTEAEWEYAARWNDQRVYPWGPETPNCVRANYRQSGCPGICHCVGWTAPAGSTPAGANALGLLDMAGNISEWCNDWQGSYEPAEVSDPPGPAGGSNRIVRGGGWNNYPSELRCTKRFFHNVPSTSNLYLGFRICRMLD